MDLNDHTFDVIVLKDSDRMTGQLISGTPMKDAVMYQQIIMFMISASTALGVLNAVVVCLHTHYMSAFE